MGREICNFDSGGKNNRLIFKPLKIEGAYCIEIEKNIDDRGFFARVWDKKIFEENKINSEFVQSNISFNEIKGTLRGMHFQKEPHGEDKLVRCTKGSAYEIILDIRKKSKTFKKWMGVKIDAKDYNLLFVPKGCALGFQTLEDNTELFYQMTEEYFPESSAGIRYNDPEFEIKWPLPITNISKKDELFEDWKQD